jgi:hypothetical protein
MDYLNVANGYMTDEEDAGIHCTTKSLGQHVWVFKDIAR